MDLVVGLQALGREDLAVAGGKGANLGELLRAGMPVPPGFVATTAAYERAVTHARAAPIIAEALLPEDAGGGDGHDPGVAVRRAFEDATVPADVEAAVRSAYRELGGGPVAVRSSATAEDLPAAAFAGQQETFLNVIGEPQLLDAVRRCWASLWSDRAIAYRRRLGMHSGDVKLAVVVQVMAPAETAGVLFTSDPVSGDRAVTVIDAGAGLGEAVVSGQVTPDHYALRRARWWPGGWRLTEQRLGRGEVIIRERVGGGTERVEAAPREAGMPLLAKPTLRRLARLGAAIETHFGAPQDVEWALVNGHPVILQARSITAIAPPPPTRNRLARTIAGLVAELVAERPYPLEATSWGPELVLSAVLGPMFRLLGVAVAFDELFVEEDGVLVRLRSRLPIHPTPAVLLAPARLLGVALRHAPARWREDPHLAEALRTARELEARDPRGQTLAELTASVREAMTLPVHIGTLRVRYAPRALLATAQLALAVTLLGRRDLLPTLLFSGVETKTLEVNRALESLATRIRATPALARAFADTPRERLQDELARSDEGRAFLEAFAAFLAAYGHRETGSTLQASRPTWRDAPQAVLGLLAGMARADTPPGPGASGSGASGPAAPGSGASGSGASGSGASGPDVSRAGASASAAGASGSNADATAPHAGQPPSGTEAFEWAHAAMHRHPVLRAPTAARAFDRLLARARRFPELREDTRFYATLALPSIRRALLEMGRRLVEDDVLDEPEAVFHVKLAELETFARRSAGATAGRSVPLDVRTLRDLVATRMAKRAELATTPVVDLRFFAHQRGDASALVSGSPGSPGIAEGRVRVVMGADDFGTLHPGEVLVAPFTNPAWTPLFQHAAAVVVDSGGPASHAAIVAREYGIPAVMGTADGTRRLVTGQRVIVDGSGGVVRTAPETDGAPTGVPRPASDGSGHVD